MLNNVVFFNVLDSLTHAWHVFYIAGFHNGLQSWLPESMPGLLCCEEVFGSHICLFSLKKNLVVELTAK